MRIVPDTIPGALLLQRRNLFVFGTGRLPRAEVKSTRSNSTLH